MDYPFTEENNMRTFFENVLQEDLLWHRDEQDRYVSCQNDTDWQLQLDNNLPFRIIKDAVYFIPKDEWHRLIKGTYTLILKIDYDIPRR